MLGILTMLLLASIIICSVFAVLEMYGALVVGSLFNLVAVIILVIMCVIKEKGEDKK